MSAWSMAYTYTCNVASRIAPSIVRCTFFYELCAVYGPFLVPCLWPGSTALPSCRLPVLCFRPCPLPFFCLGCILAVGCCGWIKLLHLAVGCVLCSVSCDLRLSLMSSMLHRALGLVLVFSVVSCCCALCTSTCHRLPPADCSLQSEIVSPPAVAAVAAVEATFEALVPASNAHPSSTYVG
jgi:hypothetical protein